MLESVRKKIYQIIDWLRISYSSFLMFSAALIGLLAGFGALLFNKLIQFFRGLALGSETSILETLASLPWWHILLATTIGGAVVGPLVYFFAREAKGHGVPEVMHAVALKGGVIRPRVVIIKALASAITLGFGGSVGREGPIVQIGSALGSTLGQTLKVSREHLRILVACGAAGGIAATFNAPIAGVMFSVEIILGSYAIHTLTPLVLSSVIATIVSRAYEGDVTSFAIPAYRMVHPFEILPYIVLAVLCALIALGFTRFLYKLEDMVEAIPLPEWLKTPLGFLLVACMVLAVPDLYGVGYETIDNVFKGEIIWPMMFALAALKIVATSLTLSAGGSGGVFAPSLFIGATFGGAYGYLVHQLFPTLTSGAGAYAVVGMAALVAGATHAPLTAFLIIFEMTGDYHLILPLMIGAILSSYLSTRLSKDNIYTLKLARRGIDLSEGMEVSIMQSIKVAEVMNRSASCFVAETPFDTMMSKMLSSRESDHYVIDGDERFLGVISVNSMKDMLSEREALGLLLVAGDVADKSHAEPVFTTTALADCMEAFSRYAVQQLPVVEEGSGKLLGCVSRRDIISVYSREIMRQGSETVKFIQRQPARIEHSGYVDIPEDLELRQIKVHHGIAGKTLAEMDIRKNYKVTVVAIGSAQDDATSVTTIPDPQKPLELGQRLVIVGGSEDLAVFTDLMRRAQL